jgi:hypothetical protein
MAGKTGKSKGTGLGERIRRVTQDLQALEEEMGWALIQDDTRAEQHRLMEELLSFNLVNQFKSAVDHMRHFLWCYIESAMGPRRSSVDYLLQSQRLKQVTEMLRTLREQGGEFGKMPEAATFLEQVTAVVEGYYEARGEKPENLAPPAGSA